MGGRSPRKRRSPSDVVRAVLTEHLRASVRRATALDLARGFGLIGCVRGLPVDLSTNPDHFEGFGRGSPPGPRRFGRNFTTAWARWLGNSRKSSNPTACRAVPMFSEQEDVAGALGGRNRREGRMALKLFWSSVRPLT